IVAESSTLRRHLEAEHYNKYHQWAKKKDFTSALPGDKKRAAVAAAAKVVSQPTLDASLKEIPGKEIIIPYSYAAFREAAIEWLIATDQPLDVLEHPKFRNMIEISARAKDGVRIPGRKATRDEIMDLFNRRMEQLKVKLNVNQ
ncbi:hypothetical protein B0H14DRAFT_2422886, partial [Mycena olivaceomarginata]